MKTTTRVFESRKLRTRKFFGIPVPVLAMLIIAGVVAAAYVSKQLNSSAPQTIQGTALTFKATTDPGLTPSVALNTLQVTTIDVQGIGGYVTPVKLQVVIGSSSVSDNCASLASKMNDGSTLGKIATAVFLGGSTYVTLDLASGTSAVAFGFVGGCALPVTVSTYTPTGTAADAWDVKWQFVDFPAGSITYGFVASSCSKRGASRPRPFSFFGRCFPPS